MTIKIDPSPTKLACLTPASMENTKTQNNESTRVLTRKKTNTLVFHTPCGSPLHNPVDR